VQKVVADAAQQVQRATVDNYIKGTYDRESFGEFTQKGGRLLEAFPAADQALFAKTAREVWEATAKEMGQKAIDNRVAVTKALGG
jgi:hypothetical protein